MNLNHKLKSVEELKPWESNARKIGSKALRGLKVSIEEFGDLSGIVLNIRNECLVSGHQRIKVMLERFGDQVKIENNSVVLPTGARFPVRLVDWDELKHAAANIAANNPFIEGDFITEKVIANLEGVERERIEGLNIDDLMDDLGEGKKKEEESPEIAFTTEMMEESNYVVFVFNNSFDWNVVEEKLAIEGVKALDSRVGYMRTGIGRVIEGKILLKVLGTRK